MVVVENGAAGAFVASNGVVGYVEGVAVVGIEERKRVVDKTMINGRWLHNGGVLLDNGGWVGVCQKSCRRGCKYVFARISGAVDRMMLVSMLL